MSFFPHSERLPNYFRLNSKNLLTNHFVLPIFYFIYFQKSNFTQLSMSLYFFLSTVWKLHDFSATQILREIKVKKSAVFTHLEVMNSNFHGYLHFLNHQINKIQSQPLKLKNGSFKNSRFPKFDFTQNLRDRKILKFPHCEKRVQIVNLFRLNALLSKQKVEAFEKKELSSLNFRREKK